MRILFSFALSALILGSFVQVQAEHIAKKSATISLKASRNGFVTVRDENGAITEIIDQRKLRLNQPSPETEARIRAFRQERQERSKEVLKQRKDDKKARKEANLQRAKQLQDEAAEAAKIKQAAAFMKYEEEKALPLMDPWTGIYRTAPVIPEGYAPDWNQSKS